MARRVTGRQHSGSQVENDVPLLIKKGVYPTATSDKHLDRGDLSSKKKHSPSRSSEQKSQSGAKSKGCV